MRGREQEGRGGRGRGGGVRDRVRGGVTGSDRWEVVSERWGV